MIVGEKPTVLVIFLVGVKNDVAAVFHDLVDIEILYVGNVFLQGQKASASVHRKKRERNEGD